MNNFELIKVKNRWAIFDKIARIYYFGTKRELQKTLKDLQKEMVF